MLDQATYTDSKSREPWSHRRIRVGNIELHAVEAGSGPLVVLLHGFPEYWGSWRNQLPALANAGYHALALDMRGYNESDKPKGVAPYHLNQLTADVAGVIRAVGESRARAVIGHDWGGGIAWQFAMDYPDLYERLAILNCPHPLKMQEGLRRPAQLKKSWYMFFFQLPMIPEFFMRKTDFWLLRRSMKEDGIGPDQIEEFVKVISVPAGLTGPINYYRSMMRSVALGRAPGPHKIDKPVLVIWGERDRYLGKDLAQPHSEWVPRARVEFVPDATHWVQHDAPKRVNELLVEFLRE